MKFDWKIGNEYVTRDGRTAKVTEIKYDIIKVTLSDGATHCLWLDTGTGNRSSLTPCGQDIVAAVVVPKVGDKFTSYAGRLVTLIAIVPTSPRPYIFQDLTGYVESVKSVAGYKPVVVPTKVKVRLAFVDGDIYSATKRDAFLNPLPGNAILRTVEVEL